jgi:hypothetical protein
MVTKSVSVTHCFCLQDWKYGTSIQLSEELARTCTEAEKNSFQILIKLLQDTQRTRELDKTCLTKFENQSASGIRENFYLNKVFSLPESDTGNYGSQNIRRAVKNLLQNSHQKFNLWQIHSAPMYVSKAIGV